MSNTDRLQNLLANIIEFTTGEKLNADKLNALINIINTNIAHISGVTGDVHDSNVDENLSSRSYWGKQFDSNINAFNSKQRRFDIANITRLIGPASNLNPQAVTVEPKEFTEMIPIGSLEYWLTKPMHVGSDLTIGNLSLIDSGTDFSAENQFKVLNKRQVLFSNPTAEGLEVVYFTLPADYNGGPNYQGARFNVYPDPNQTTTKLSIVYNLAEGSNSPTYRIELPSITHQQISLSERTTAELDNQDLNHNVQMLLPEWICNLDDNSVLPQYSLYLKNYTTNEAYFDATYTKINNSTILVSNLNIGNQNCVDDFDLRIVTVGTDITTSIDDLRNKMYLHNHDGSFGEPSIDIRTLAGIFNGEAPSGIYGPASEAWNPLPNYLHRDGWVISLDNDVNGQNAMRGNILMSVTTFDPLTNKAVIDSDTTSHAIYFGNETNKIYRRNDTLVSFGIVSNNVESDEQVNVLAPRITLNTESFEVKEEDLNASISSHGTVTPDDGSLTLIPDPSSEKVILSSIDKDITTTDVKTTRKKVIKYNILNQINISNPIYENEFSYIEDGVTYKYIDPYTVVQTSLTANPPSLQLEEVQRVNQPTRYIHAELFGDDISFVNKFWRNDTTDINLTNFYIDLYNFALFVVGNELNCTYNFKLYSVYGLGGLERRIYSPVYKAGNAQEYRRFFLAINRFIPLQLNYSSFENDYIYEHEYIINIDMLHLGTDRPVWNTNGNNNLVLLPDNNNNNPYVVLCYNAVSVYLEQSQKYMLLAEQQVFGYGLWNGDQNKPNGIKRIYVSTPNLDVVDSVPGETDDTVSNLGEDMVHVYNDDIYIRVGRNVSDSSGNNSWGVLEFDKLLIKEKICNGDLFVEVIGYTKDRSKNEFYLGRYKDGPELPPESVPYEN